MEKPPKYVSPPGTWKTKTALRVASLVCLVIVAGVGGSLAATPRVDFDAAMILVLLVPLVVMFVWDIAEIICILARGGHRGIHPGAIVAIDLLAWLGWFGVDFFLGVAGVATRGYTWIRYYSGYSNESYGYRHGSYDPSKALPEDLRLENEIEGKGRALIAFSSLIIIIHFALFVIGCYETNIRNRLPRTVYVMQPIYGAPHAVQGGYQQLGFVPAQPLPGQPLAPGQMVYMQVPPGQLPVQPPPAVTTETKTGADRLA